jgi:hypothetical protein
MKDFFDKWAPHFGSGILARPLLAVLLTSGYVYMTIQGIDPGDAYVAILTAVVGYFFSSQAAEKMEERLQAQQQQAIELAKAIPTDTPK